jgi:hypothetical protein
MRHRDAPRLGALQERFYRLMTAPVSVARALPDAGLERRDVDAWFLGDERLDAVARLDLYANMYFFRIRDVLRELFPRLVAIVRDDAFHNLITDYLVACPPAHFSIPRAGARLPGFVAGHALGLERPWLAHLAAVEWATEDLHDGPDATPLDHEALRAVSPAEIGELRLGLTAFRSWGELRNPSAVKSWLLRILHNNFVSASRRRSSRRPAFVDLNIEELLTHPLLQYREALWLIDVEELTIAEAAEVVDRRSGRYRSLSRSSCTTAPPRAPLRADREEEVRCERPARTSVARSS